MLQVKKNILVPHIMLKYKPSVFLSFDSHISEDCHCAYPFSLFLQLMWSVTPTIVFDKSGALYNIYILSSLCSLYLSPLFHVALPSSIFGSINGSWAAPEPSNWAQLCELELNNQLGYQSRAIAEPSRALATLLRGVMMKMRVATSRILTRGSVWM